MNLTEDELIKIVKNNPYEIRYIKNQTEKMCLEAVKQNGDALQFVKNQNNLIALEAVEQHRWAFRFVKNQNDFIVSKAIKKNGNTLQFVKNQTNEICLDAIKQDANAFTYIKNQNIILNECLKINSYIIYLLRNCNTSSYIIIFRYLLNNIHLHKKIDILFIEKIHIIGYALKDHIINNSFITIFINFLIEQHEYSVLQTIRMEQPFYNDIKK